MQLHIVEVNAENLDTYVSIGSLSYTHHFSDLWSDEDLKKYLAEQYGHENLQASLEAGINKYFICYHNFEPIGIIKLALNSPLPGSEIEKGLELVKIYFLKEFTGNGFGSAAMNFVISTGRHSGKPFIWLDVFKTNVKAIQFYERFGFKIAGEMDFDSGKEKIEMWVMKLDLN